MLLSIVQGLNRVRNKHLEAFMVLNHQGRFADLIIHRDTVKRAECMCIEWEARNPPEPVYRDITAVDDGYVRYMRVY